VKPVSGGANAGCQPHYRSFEPIIRKHQCRLSLTCSALALEVVMEGLGFSERFSETSLSVYLVIPNRIVEERSM